MSKPDSDDFERVKRYLLGCPFATADSSPALKAALEGVRRAEERAARDRRLQSSFVKSKSESASSPQETAVSAGLGSDDVVVVEGGGKSSSAVHVSTGRGAAAAAAVSSGVPMKRKERMTDNDDFDDEKSDDMEWQDVAHADDVVGAEARAAGDGRAASNGCMASGDDSNNDSSGSGDMASALGQQLARSAIDAIASHDVRVSSPVAAVAAILHASLCSVGFSCTGVPDEVFRAGRKGANGFAPPIRDIKTFLPADWESHAGDASSSSASGNGDGVKGRIALRYRKQGSTSMVLLVQEQCMPSDGNDDGSGGGSTGVTVTIRYIPASSVKSASVWDEAIPTTTSTQTATSTMDTDDTRGLSFPLARHVNLDSWNAACQKQGKTKRGGGNSSFFSVAPALHYMSLSSLLTVFCRAFDLGGPVEEYGSNGVSTELPYRDSTVVPLPPASSTSRPARQGDFAPPQYQPVPASVGRPSGRPWASTVPASIGEAFPLAGVGYGPPGGDFGGDLGPAGLPNPHYGIPGGFGGGGGMDGGNLMGPNHPMFMGPGGMNGGGRGSMQPRFDPFGPPGGPQEPPRNGNKGNKRWTGEPDPDNLRPDMFS